MMWRIVFQLSRPFWSIPGDFGSWLWNVWWVKRALVDLRTSPYFTADLFYPTGTSLVFHNLSPYNGLIGIPLQLLGIDLIATYNLLYLSSFVIGGVSMFLLVRELTGNPFAAFFAGVAYAFFPSRTITYATMNLWAIQWLPLALFFAVRLIRDDRRSDSVGLAVVFVLATLCDWHQPVLLLLAIGVLALSSVLSREPPMPVPSGLSRRLAWSGLLYALLVSPLAYVVLRQFVAGDAILQTPSWFVWFELAGYRKPGGDLIGYPVLLGWISTALVGYGIFRGLDFWTRRFAGLLVAFFVLSLGEGLKLPTLTEPVLPLPFVLWRKIPLLGIVRGSVYFWVMVQVCFAVLAGHGVRRLWERMEARGREGFPHVRPLLGVGLLGLMLVEVAPFPVPRTPPRIHPVYEAIQRDGRRGAILDVPIRYTIDRTPYPSGISLYLQTFHHRPLVDGYTQFTGRERLAFLESNRFLTIFADHWIPPEMEVPDATEGLRSFLSTSQIDWVILRNSMREEICDRRPTRRLGWSLKKFLNLVAPAVVNEALRSIWSDPGHYCYDWDAGKAMRATTVVRQVLGAPLVQDAELTAYRVR